MTNFSVIPGIKIIEVIMDRSDIIISAIDAPDMVLPKADTEKSEVSCIQKNSYMTIRGHDTQIHLKVPYDTEIRIWATGDGTVNFRTAVERVSISIRQNAVLYMKDVEGFFKHVNVRAYGNSMAHIGHVHGNLLGVVAGGSEITGENLKADISYMIRGRSRLALDGEFSKTNLHIKGKPEIEINGAKVLSPVENT